MNYSITQEALLATTKLSVDTNKAAAQSPKDYTVFKNATTQRAIMEREMDKGGDAEDFSPDESAPEQPTDHDSEDTQEGTVDDNDEKKDEVDPSSDPSPKEEAEGGDEQADVALADSISEDTEQTSESLSEWISDKTRHSESSLVRGAGAVASGLAYLGVKYGPTILNNIGKGAVWTFSRIGEGIQKGSVSLSRMIDKTINSVKNLEARLDAAEKTIVEGINGDKEMTKFQITNQAAINQLRVNDDVDISGNIRSLAENISVVVKGLSDSFDDSIDTINNIANTSTRGKVEDLSKFMVVKPPKTGFRLGALPGYSEKDGAVKSFHTYPIWPGNASLVLDIPNFKGNDTAVIKKSYSDAGVYMGFIRSKTKIESIESLNATETLMLAKSIRILLSSMKEVSKSQTKMKSRTLDIGNIAKRAFFHLADAKAKEKMDNTMVEPIYLQSKLATEVVVEGSNLCLIHASKVAASAIYVLEQHASRISK